MISISSAIGSLSGNSSGFLGGSPISLYFLQLCSRGWLLGSLVLKLVRIIPWFGVGDLSCIKCVWQRSGIGPLGGKRAQVGRVVEELVEIAEDLAGMSMSDSPCMHY